MWRAWCVEACCVGLHEGELGGECCQEQGQVSAEGAVTTAVYRVLDDRKLSFGSTICMFVYGYFVL